MIQAQFSYLKHKEGNHRLNQLRINSKKTLNWMTLKVADRTGLEPATSGVTGQHSNQLNYRSFGSQTSNKLPYLAIVTFSLIKVVGDDEIRTRRHSPCKGDALPTELITLNIENAHFTYSSAHVNKSFVLKAQD